MILAKKSTSWIGAIWLIDWQESLAGTCVRRKECIWRRCGKVAQGQGWGSIDSAGPGSNSHISPYNPSHPAAARAHLAHKRCHCITFPVSSSPTCYISRRISLRMPAYLYTSLLDCEVRSIVVSLGNAKRFRTAPKSDWGWYDTLARTEIPCSKVQPFCLPFYTKKCFFSIQCPHILELRDRRTESSITISYLYIHILTSKQYTPL
jgi:hypothetical protein